jgi:hypothetical protein
VIFISRLTVSAGFAQGIPCFHKEKKIARNRYKNSDTCTSCIDVHVDNIDKVDMEPSAAL